MNEITYNFDQKRHFEQTGLIFLAQKNQYIISQYISKNKVDEEIGDSGKLACSFACYRLIPLNELRVTCSYSMPTEMKKISPVKTGKTGRNEGKGIFAFFFTAKSQKVSPRVQRTKLCVLCAALAGFAFYLRPARWQHATRAPVSAIPGLWSRLAARW